MIKLVTEKEDLGAYTDLKLVRQGSTRTLTVGRLTPEDWEIVRASLVEVNNEYILIRLRRLA